MVYHPLDRADAHRGRLAEIATEIYFPTRHKVCPKSTRGGALYKCASKKVRMRGDPFLKEVASPNPSTKNFLNLAVNDTDMLWPS